MPTFNSPQYLSQVTPGEFMASPDHGNVRALTFEYNQGAVAGASGDDINLVRLPAGRIRVLTDLSRVNVSALGASRVMDVGFRAYSQPNASAGAAPTVVALDADYFCSAVDVSAASSTLMNESTTPSRAQTLNSTAGIDVYATITGGTIPANATVTGTIFWVQA